MKHARKNIIYREKKTQAFPRYHTAVILIGCPMVREHCSNKGREAEADADMSTFSAHPTRPSTIYEPERKKKKNTRM